MDGEVRKYLQVNEARNDRAKTLGLRLELEDVNGGARLIFPNLSEQELVATLGVYNPKKYEIIGDTE